MPYKVYQVKIEYSTAISAIMNNYDADQASDLISKDQWNLIASFSSFEYASLFIDAIWESRGFEHLYTIREEKD